jgi:hypothetical protein
MGIIIYRWVQIRRVVLTRQINKIISISYSRIRVNNNKINNSLLQRNSRYNFK